MLRGVVEQQGSTMFPQPVNLLMNVKPAIQVKSQSQLIKSNWNVSSPPPPSQWLSMKRDQVDQNPVFLLMSLTSDTTSEYEMSEFSIVASLLKKNPCDYFQFAKFLFLIALALLLSPERKSPIPREKK